MFVCMQTRRGEQESAMDKLTSTMQNEFKRLHRALRRRPGRLSWRPHRRSATRPVSRVARGRGTAEVGERSELEGEQRLRSADELNDGDVGVGVGVGKLGETRAAEAVQTRTHTRTHTRMCMCNAEERYNWQAAALRADDCMYMQHAYAHVYTHTTHMFRQKAATIEWLAVSG